MALCSHFVIPLYVAVGTDTNVCNPTVVQQKTVNWDDIVDKQF